jgi:hypothetical protein
MATNYMPCFPIHCHLASTNGLAFSNSPALSQIYTPEVLKAISLAKSLLKPKAKR